MAGQTTPGYSFTTTEQVTAAKLASLATCAVTGIINSDIASGAAIADSKLAQIATAGKVHGTSITGLASLPSGAGEIPAANIPTLAIAKIPYKDEDDMASNSATYVPTQQSVKAYVDGKVYTGSVKVGTTTHDISVTGNQDVTGIGFQPICVDIISGINGQIMTSIGFSDGTNQGSSCTYYNSTDVKFVHAPSHAINLYTSDTAAAQGSITMLADGFRIGWTKSSTPTGTAQIYYKCTK